MRAETREYRIGRSIILRATPAMARRTVVSSEPMTDNLPHYVHVRAEFDTDASGIITVYIVVRCRGQVTDRVRHNVLDTLSSGMTHPDAIRSTFTILGV